jgi:hypothetical protein
VEATGQVVPDIYDIGVGINGQGSVGAGGCETPVLIIRFDAVTVPPVIVTLPKIVAKPVLLE